VSILLRPRWIAGHLLALVTIVAFVNLGLWQLRRHDEKSDLRQMVAEAQSTAPVPITQAPAGSYRQVMATGAYDPTLQTKVLRSQGGISGYHVLTPFLLDDGTAVLVDRGWIPLDALVPEPHPVLQSITGTLWPAEEGSSIPDSLTPAVRRIDPEIPATFAAYRFRDEYLVLSGSEFTTAVEPVLPTAPEVSLGPHFGYAVQWFVFATVVVVGYPLLLRRTLRRTPAAG
jgi:surfeit locus 1 family protein